MGKFFKITSTALLGAVVGYAAYMISKDKFSDETKNDYDEVVSTARNVGVDLQRTYTSIGDEASFKHTTKGLKENATTLTKQFGRFIKNASTDMYKDAGKNIKNAIKKAKDNEAKKDAIKNKKGSNRKK